jgi:hypothetical protein
VKDARIPGAAWAIIGVAVPVHVGLALATDLSPDEAYYLCAARAGAGIVDHPPLTVWLLAATDRWTSAPVELRVRVWAVLFSLATSVACVALARARGAGREGCTLAAWVGSWALLPMAGGFVTTPDGPLLLSVAVGLLVATSPGRPIATAPMGALALLAGALAKVVAVPIGVLFAASARRAPAAVRLGLAAGPLLALPLLLPSLRFQLRHAYGSVAPGGWSLPGAAGALVAAAGAQALLWSPLVLWNGLRRLATAPLPDRVLVVGLTAMLLASALIRAVPPEPNWWAPAALVVVTACAASAADLSARARRALLATVLLPTAIATAHTARPFLRLPERADPTARLHGWSHGHEPLDSVGVGPYGPAAEHCVYRGACDGIRLYFNEMHANERSRR